MTISGIWKEGKTGELLENPDVVGMRRKMERRDAIERKNKKSPKKGLETRQNSTYSEALYL